MQRQRNALAVPPAPRCSEDSGIQTLKKLYCGDAVMPTDHFSPKEARRYTFVGTSAQQRRDRKPLSSSERRPEELPC